MGAESALVASGLAPGADGMWVAGDGVVAAVLTGHGAFVGWLDVVCDDDGVGRRLRDVEHVADPRAYEAACRRARRARERSLRPCSLCETGLMPGHLH